MYVCVHVRVRVCVCVRARNMRVDIRVQTRLRWMCLYKYICVCIKKMDKPVPGWLTFLICLHREFVRLQQGNGMQQINHKELEESGDIKMGT